MTVYQFHRIVGLKRQLSRQQSVKSHAQRIKVCPVVNPPIHPSRLFGRQIAECSFQHVWIETAIVPPAIRKKSRPKNKSLSGSQSPDSSFPFVRETNSRVFLPAR